MHLHRNRVTLATAIFAFQLLINSCASSEPAQTADSRAVLCPHAGSLLAESSEIDARGAFHGTANYDLNDKVLELAECSARTSDDYAAEVVTRILLRYAAVVQQWPLINRDGTVSGAIDFAKWDLGGLWGGEWIYIDLGKSVNLARAFELIKENKVVDKVGEQLGVDARTVIREQLLRYLVDFNLRFGRGERVGTNTREASFPFNNMDPYRLKRLAVFGRVVDPAYIHIAVRMLRLFPEVGFFRDGFWHEGTISYHRQVVDGLDDLVTILTGYTDPPGYEHSGYTTLFGDYYEGVLGRFDNLDPIGKAAEDFARTQTAERALTLPDGTMLAKNDTHHDLHEIEKGDPSNVPSQSICLFALRHCVLVGNRGKETVLLHLDYGGTEGHEHYDALNIDLWGQGRLLLGDGTYRGFSPREWNMSTAAHNTVWVNRLNQDTRFDDRARLTSEDEIDGVGNHLYQGFGQGDSENAGQLLSADLSGGRVQYVAADASKGYDAHMDIKKYERTLVLVDGEEDEDYVVDIFHVDGGSLHEWMLHGDLSSDPEIHTSLDERPAGGSMGPYLKIEKIATANLGWTSNFIYPDEDARLRTYHLENAESEVVLARGPAQVREGEATFLSVRKIGPRHTFIAVHIPQGDSSLIDNVTSLPAKYEDDPCVRMRVEFASGRKDEIAVQTDQTAISGQGCDGEGSHINAVATAPKGYCLWRYQGDLATGTSFWQGGGIEVFRREAGNSKNGFRITNWPSPDGTTVPNLLHLKLPNGTVESYPILSLERFDDQSVFIEVDGEPGLRIEARPNLGPSAAHVKQLYYPSRGFVGKVAYRTTTNAFQKCDSN